MRPFDPRMLRAVPESRRGVGALAALGVIAGSLAIAQAFTVTSLVVAVVGGMPVRPSLLAVVAVLTGRALVSATTEW
ncbi:MAG: thiol reductant ABC exporter subunit CydD, partial [Candidatus Lutibacillus vidarii]